MRTVAFVRLGVSTLACATSLLLVGCVSRQTAESRVSFPPVPERSLAERLHERMEHPDPTLPHLPADYSTPGSPNAVIACYDPANPPAPEMIQHMEETLYGLSLQYQLGSRWSTTSSGSTGGTGNPIVLTWSLVPDGITIPSGVGEPAASSSLFAQMDAKFGGNRALWIQRLTDCFTRWSQVSGITYQRITFGGNDWDDGAAWGSVGVLGRRGDVRIGGKNIDGVNGVLAYDSMPDQSDMVIDTSENWGQSASSYRFLRNVVMHEHGHGLGFAHVCPTSQTKLMEPFYSAAYDGPQQDDIRGVQRYYGDPNEPDNGASTSTDLGTLAPGALMTVGGVPTVIPSTPANYTVPTVANASTLSIDADSESDWFKFTLAQPLLASATLTPIGSTYLQAAQDANCNTGTANNALAAANLRLQFMASDGFSTVANIDANAAGLGETLTQVLLPAGVSYVRVSESSTPTETQFYRVTLSLGLALSFTASDGAFTDHVALTWTAIPNVFSYRVFRNTTNDRLSATVLTTQTTVGFDDTTAVPGTTYYYWLQAAQTGSFLDMGGPETGFAQQVACPADFNQDGSVNPDDLGDYITCFFTDPPCTGADFNIDGSINPDDLGDFITTFFGPPC